MAISCAWALRCGPVAVGSAVPRCVGLEICHSPVASGSWSDSGGGYSPSSLSVSSASLGCDGGFGGGFFPCGGCLTWGWGCCCCGGGCGLSAGLDGFGGCCGGVLAFGGGCCCCRAGCCGGAPASGCALGAVGPWGCVCDPTVGLFGWFGPGCCCCCVFCCVGALAVGCACGTVGTWDCVCGPAAGPLGWWGPPLLRFGACVSRRVSVCPTLKVLYGPPASRATSAAFGVVCMCISQVWPGVNVMVPVVPGGMPAWRVSLRAARAACPALLVSSGGTWNTRNLHWWGTSVWRISTALRGASGIVGGL